MDFSLVALGFRVLFGIIDSSELLRKRVRPILRIQMIEVSLEQIEDHRDADEDEMIGVSHGFSDYVRSIVTKEDLFASRSLPEEGNKPGL